MRLLNLKRKERAGKNRRQVSGKLLSTTTRCLAVAAAARFTALIKELTTSLRLPVRRCRRWRLLVYLLLLAAFIKVLMGLPFLCAHTSFFMIYCSCKTVTRVGAVSAAAQVSAVPQIYDIWVQKQQKNKKENSYAKGVNRREQGEMGAGYGL